MSERPHPLPAWVEPLCKQFGTNPHGGPMYRVVWSEDRFEWFYDEQKRKYGNGRDRWMLEKWCPPNMYGARAEWELLVEPVTGRSILGPFPENGDYEHCWTFEIRVNEGEEMSYMPLREDIVNLMIRAIEAGKMRHTEAERKAAIQRRQEEAEKEKHRLFDDLWDDSRPAPGAKIPDHIQMLDSFGAKTTADLPAFLPKRSFKQIGEINASNES